MKYIIGIFLFIIFCFIINAIDQKIGSVLTYILLVTILIPNLAKLLNSLK